MNQRTTPTEARADLAAAVAAGERARRWTDRRGVEQGPPSARRGRAMTAAALHLIVVRSRRGPAAALRGPGPGREWVALAALLWVGAVSRVVRVCR